MNTKVCFYIQLVKDIQKGKTQVYNSLHSTEYKKEIHFSIYFIILVYNFNAKSIKE